MTGSGTLLDPYVIYNVNDLQAVQNDLTAYYELANNIDASATVGWNGGLGFKPIGQSSPYFSGQLDGKGYSINDLTINRPATWRNGLFGHVEEQGLITDVHLKDINITGSTHTGGLVGSNYGIIQNCSVTGQVTGSGGTCVGGLAGYSSGEIKESNSTATVSNPTGNYVGGLVGLNSGGSLFKCYATGSVSGDDRVGGLAGESYYDGAEVLNCYARGNVSGVNLVGGLVGELADVGVINKCYSTGAVTGSTSVGGLVGENYNSQGLVSNSFWDTETSGQATSDGGTGKTTAQMKDSATFIDAGWDFDTIWSICGGVNNNYPCLLGVTPSCILAPVFTCPYCGAGFDTEGERDAHIASEHPSVPYSRAYALAREEL